MVKVLPVLKVNISNLVQCSLSLFKVKGCPIPIYSLFNVIGNVIGIIQEFTPSVLPKTINNPLLIS